MSNKPSTKKSLNTKKSILISALSLIVAFTSILSNIAITMINNNHSKMIEYDKLTFKYKIDSYNKYSSTLDQIYDAMDEETLRNAIIELEQSINELSFFLADEQVKEFRKDLYNFRRNSKEYLSEYYQNPYLDFYSSAGRKTTLKPFTNFRDEIRILLMPDYLPNED